MAKRRQGQSGKKAGSIIHDPIEPASNRTKKKPRKQSKGKQKH